MNANVSRQPVSTLKHLSKLGAAWPRSIASFRPQMKSPVIFQKLEDELQPVLKYLRGRVLNAGCGERDITQFLLENGASEVDQCDLKTSIPNAILCDLGSIPRPAGLYDSILCNAVLEHVRDVDAVMKELRRLLKPDGCLILSIPFLQPNHSLDFRRYTREGMLDLARTYNYEVVELLPVNSIAQTLTWIAWSYLQEKRKRVLQLLLWLPLYIWSRSCQRTDFALQINANGFQMVLRKSLNGKVA